MCFKYHLPHWVRASALSTPAAPDSSHSSTFLPPVPHIWSGTSGPRARVLGGLAASPPLRVFLWSRAGPTEAHMPQSAARWRSSAGAPPRSCIAMYSRGTVKRPSQRIARERNSIAAPSNDSRWPWVWLVVSEHGVCGPFGFIHFP